MSTLLNTTRSEAVKQTTRQSERDTRDNKTRQRIDQLESLGTHRTRIKREGQLWDLDATAELRESSNNRRNPAIFVSPPPPAVWRRSEDWIENIHKKPDESDPINANPPLRSMVLLIKLQSGALHLQLTQLATSISRNMMRTIIGPFRTIKEKAAVLRKKRLQGIFCQTEDLTIRSFETFWMHAGPNGSAKFQCFSGGSHNSCDNAIREPQCWDAPSLPLDAHRFLPEGRTTARVPANIAHGRGCQADRCFLRQSDHHTPLPRSCPNSTKHRKEVSLLPAL
ncbi:hypothetical protein J6590_092590 [Homalodisca vitripennis]|nr:hypothetical protein J6590_092590 [Homalodisca vitripennis]